MIAASDPQEFVPSGRQRLLRHPGPSDIVTSNGENKNFAPEFLLSRFKQVSITEKRQSEWWLVRKSPDNSQQNVSAEKRVCDKSFLGLSNASKFQNTGEGNNSWTWTSAEPLKHKTVKRLSDIQGPKKKDHANNELFNESLKPSSVLNDISKADNINCKNVGVMEEELYVKDNVVIWSKGLTSTGSSCLSDSARSTLCSYTSQNLVKCAKWCTFYRERPTFDTDTNFKLDEPLGVPMPSICIIDNQNLQVFTIDNEDFVTSLPFEVAGLWTTKFGILLEKEASKTFGTKCYGGHEGNKHSKTHEEEELSPTMFSMSHPLDECSPVAIKHDSIRLFDDNSLNVVFTSENPSICMLHDTNTGEHSVYYIRKMRNDEWVELSSKLTSTIPTLPSLSNKLRNRLSVLEGKRSVSNFSSSPSSLTSAHSSNQLQSRLQSPMAAISRCQSPALSPSMATNAWLQKSSRVHSSFRNLSTNMSMSTNMTNFDTTEVSHHLNPTICLDHVWTDSSSHVDSKPASKVFLINDLVDYWYLCYLLPSHSQLSIVRIGFSNNISPMFEVLNEIPDAQDAIAVPHLRMMAVLHKDGNVLLYSGATIVGKLHVGGILAQLTPSPCVKRNLPQMNSPFPRRSTLLPHYGTPASDPRFEEHLLSPMTPITPILGGRTFNKNIPLSFDIGSTSKIQLNGLRDALHDRFTLQYSDGTYYRIILPTLASSTLVENCINALRLTLQREVAIVFLTRWYSVRNAPGSSDLSLDEEWRLFTSLTLEELFGHNSDCTQTSDTNFDTPMTPSASAKRQKPSSLGTDLDWNSLLDSQHNNHNLENLSSILHLQSSNAQVPTQPKSTNSTIDTNALLFTSVRVIHYTLHLLYEDLKLNTTRTEELPLLAQFLSKLSRDLRLQNYVVHYWKDFPNHCPMPSKCESPLTTNALANAIYWRDMSDKPESIMQHIYNLLTHCDAPPYPYIPQVNVRSKTVVKLCGVLVKSYVNGNVPIRLDDLIKLVLPLSSGRFNTLLTPISKVIKVSPNPHETIVLLMTEMGITCRNLDRFPAGISLLLYGALWKCRENPQPDWSTEAYCLLHRQDLVAQAELIKKAKSVTISKNEVFPSNSGLVPSVLPSIKKADDSDQEDGMEDVDSPLLKLRFPEDHRVTEARRLLQSAKPVPISLVQRPEVSDHDFIEEQEKHLYAICARTMALPIGRGMFTLRTATPVITEPLPLPKLCLSGRVPPRGATIELTHIDYPQNMQHWPLFHNGVANGLRISPDAHNIDSTWIMFNKPKSSDDMEHAGFLMALGLNGHLTNLSIPNTYDYLSKLKEMTSLGILLGLSAAMRGTQNTGVTKLLCIHIEALLPPTSMELDVPQNLQVASLLGVGLLYQGSAHRHITEVLLTEIGRPPGPEMENSVDRESYSLAAGLALGLVTLKHGGRPSGLSDLNVSDTLYYYMVGGNKRSFSGSQKEKYKVPSFQIREGATVNLDVTAPGATLALGLMYFGTGNKVLADLMTPPGTQYLLDFIRPDFLLLRVLAKGLIMWDTVKASKDWVENQVPETIRPFCMVKPSLLSFDVDYEAMNQAYCNIVAGACFTLGLKYAGSANAEAFQTLLHFCHMFTSLTGKSIAELAGKPTIETCLNTVLISASLVMAGTGNLDIMRIVRHLRRRVGLSSSAVVTYGSHLAIHMALGLLFVGGGRYTLSNSPENVAAMICAFYPKFPTHSSDNRYHLQAFRHLYVLAVEPRLVIPQDVITGRMCYAGLKVVHLNGRTVNLQGPCLIPDLNTLSKVSIEDDRYWPVVFERNRNWDQLLKQLEFSGQIDVKQRAGCLSYIEDKNGYRSELARTLSHSKIIPWDPPPKVITSFSSDCAIHYFSDNLLVPDANIRSSITEVSFMKIFTKIAYDCIIKDKEALLPNFISIIKLVENLSKTPDAIQLWQFKIVCAQVLKSGISSHIIDQEIVLALRQRVLQIMTAWEDSIGLSVRSYLLGENVVNANSLKAAQLSSYISYYDIPFNLNWGVCDFDQSNYLQLLWMLNSANCTPETIEKVTQLLSLGH